MILLKKFTKFQEKKNPNTFFFFFLRLLGCVTLIFFIYKTQLPKRLNLCSFDYIEQYKVKIVGWFNYISNTSLKAGYA